MARNTSVVAEEATYSSPVASKPLPLAWSQVKSKRGRKKRIKTDGHACPNTECAYYGIRNPKIHALIDYGDHGKCMRCLHRPDPEPILPGMRNQGHEAVGHTDIQTQDDQQASSNGMS